MCESTHPSKFGNPKMSFLTASFILQMKYFNQDYILHYFTQQHSAWILKKKLIKIHLKWTFFTFLCSLRFSHANLHFPIGKKRAERKKKKRSKFFVIIIVLRIFVSFIFTSKWAELSLSCNIVRVKVNFCTFLCLIQNIRNQSEILWTSGSLLVQFHFYKLPSRAPPAIVKVRKIIMFDYFVPFSCFSNFASSFSNVQFSF